MSKNEQTGELNLSSIVNSQGQTLETHGTEISYMKWILIAIVIVLFVGFAGLFIATGAMMVDALNNKSTSYMELRDAIYDQKLEIELLKKELQNWEEEMKNIQAVQPTQPVLPKQ